MLKKSSNKYGRFAPASTGDTQYIGGLQIKYLGFDNSIETYDKKLEVYENVHITITESGYSDFNYFIPPIILYFFFLIYT